MKWIHRQLPDFKFYTRLLCVVLFALSCFSARGQSAKTVPTEFNILIDLVYRVKGDTVILISSQNGSLGFKKGDQAKIISVYNSQNKARDTKEIGYCTIVFVKGDTLGFRAFENNPTIANEKIQEGDLIQLNVALPAKPYHSLFYDLALLQIRFTNLQDKHLVKERTIFTNDSKALEDSLLTIAALDIKAVYNTFKDDAGMNNLRVPLPSGRFKGRNTLDVMAKVSRTDLLAFLKFVKSYPGKYMGHSWKISETFATWVNNNSPLNAEEVLDSVRLYTQNIPKLQKYLKNNRKEIVKDEYLKSWVIVAYNLFQSAKLTEADAIMKLTEQAGLVLNDTTGLGFYNYLKAQMVQDQDKFASALVYSNKAVVYFKQANNLEFFFKTKLKSFYLLSQVPDFPAMQVLRKELEKDLATYQAQLPPDLLQEFLGKYYGYYASAQKKKGDLNEAKQGYQLATDAYAKLQSLTGKVEGAITRENIADIETIQTNYKAAQAVYDSLLVFYKAQTLPLKRAKVLNNKSYAFSKMGDYEQSIATAKEALTIQLNNDDVDNGAFSLSQMAQSMWSLGKFEEAVKSHKLSIEYRKKANNSVGAGYSFSKLGALYTEMGDKVKALAALDSAKFYYSKTKALDNLAEVEGALGKIYKEEGNTAKAITAYLSAYASVKALGLKQEMAAQLYNVADAAYKDQPVLAYKYYQQAYTLYQETGVKDQMLYCLLNLGNIETRNKNFDAAEKFLNQALVLSKEIDGKREKAVTYAKLGDAATTRLNLAAAIENYKRAQDIYAQTSDKGELATTLLSLGYAYVGQGKFTEAQEVMQKSLEISASAFNQQGKAAAYLSLSDLFQLKGEFASSKTMIDSCFRLYKGLGNKYQLANTYIVAGNYYNRISENVKAIANYQSADSLYLSEKELESRFTTLNNIGTIYTAQNDYDQALGYFLKAKATLGPNPILSDNLILLLGNIGEIYYLKKNYPEAEKNLLQGLKYAQDKNLARATASITVTLGKLYLDKQDYANALVNLNTAYKYGLQSGESMAIIDAALYLGRVFMAEKKEKEAIDYLNIAIARAEKIGDLKMSWDALYQRGLLFYGKQQLDSAAAYFKRAVGKLELSGSNLFGGEAAKKLFSSDIKKVNLYSTLITTLIKLGKTDEALEYTAKSNSEAIREKMGQIGTQTASVEKTAALKQKDILARSVTSIQDNLEKEKAKPVAEQNVEKIASLQKVQKFAQSQLLNFVDSMVTQFSDLKDNFVKNVNPEDLRNYKSNIPEDVAVLLYVVRADQLIIFTLTKETTKAKLIDLNGDQFLADIRDFNAALKYPFKGDQVKPLKLRGVELANRAESARSLAQTGSNLYKYLIEPIKEDIAGKTKLCIINNGELSSVPFQTIGMKTAGGTLRYLVEDYSIFYTNKLDIFLKADPGKFTNASFVAYGNPDKTLPSAEKEVKEIHKIITEAEVFVGDAATEDLAKSGLTTKKIIHFATHGILDYNDFSKTFLKFAPSPGNDGKLTIQEIKGLDIEDCDLVTLSACETAVSQDVNKGWFVSPANSFLINRVKTVVASLWSVDDEATSLLMSSFYKNIKVMGKAEALRKAQETLSQNPKYTHPFFWGAFILYGEWR